MSEDRLEEALGRDRELWAAGEIDERALESIAAAAEHASSAPLAEMESSEARDVYLATRSYAAERRTQDARTATRWLWVPAGAALATFLAVLVPSLLVPDGAFQSKGRAPEPVRELDVLRVEPGERAQPLEGGTRFEIGQRLGFAYREVERPSRSITIVAFDGENIDWLYPEGPGAEVGFPLDPSRAGAGVRLPYDVELDPGLKPGTVWFLAAFDLAPAELERIVRARSFEGHPQIRVVPLELVAPKEVSP